ncbi:MAG: DUF853 domain-containing protein, partial [Deltaproteobacteria bacterium]|nr:DUF853 domain-containing protein [Deltaproteobacteria bacterium]
MSNKSDNGESLELKTLKALDLSSWLKSDSAWKDLEFDVGELNGPVRKSLKAKLEDLISKKYAQISGQPVLGQGGTGKTHLLSYLRKIVFEKKGFFILADMTTVGDFWSVLALEAAKSLEKPGFDGLPQCLGLAARLAAAAGLPLASPEEHFQKAETAEIAKLANDIFLSLFRNRQVRQEAQNFSDLIRVIFFLNSEDQEAYNWGLQWLKGTNLEMEQKFRDFGFNAFNRSAAEEAIRGLTWLSSIGGGFSVIAVDQLDSLIKYNALPTSNELEVAESARIMTGVSSGLAALISQAHDCLTVVTLLPDSWDNLVSKGLRPAMERMDRPFKLSLIPSFEVGRRLLSGRLQKAAELTGFSIPSKDWPFPEGFFDGVEYWSPRHLLNAAKKHIDNIIDNPPLPDVFKTLEEKFVEHYLAAEIGLLKHKDSEKEFWPQALAALAEAFRLGAEELAISKDLEIDWNSDKLKKNYSNYVFIKCVSPSNPAADRFFSLWAVMTTHHSRYASELETALLQSGLNGKLPQRRLALIRYDSPPNSDKCKALLKKIISENGWKFDLKETELRFIYALHKISEEFKDIFPNWAASKKPAQCLPNLSPHFSWVINSDQNWLLPASFLPDEHRDALFKSGILLADKLKEPLDNVVLDSGDAGVSSPPARKMREARQPAENPSSSSSTKDDAKIGLNLGEDAVGQGGEGQGAGGQDAEGQGGEGHGSGGQDADGQDVGRQSADDQDVGGQDAEGYDVGGEGSDGHEVDGQVVENGPKSSEEEEIMADGRNQNEVAEKRPVAKTTDPFFLIGSFVDRPEPQPASLLSSSLDKHAAIFGGTGSGKTVLLRRLIEEASLAGIPVLVIDVAGDLTYLGQSWPNPARMTGAWLEGDLDRAKKYIANANAVVWTPG